MNVSMFRPFFIAVASMAVLVLVGFICGILPESPFRAFMQAEEVNEYLSYINYFIPIDVFITIGSAWLLAVVPWIVCHHVVVGVKLIGEWIPFT